MSEAGILTASILVGAVIGRWWSIALAVPGGFAAGQALEFEGLTDVEMSLLTGFAVAIGLAVGAAARKGLGLLGRGGRSVS